MLGTPGFGALLLAGRTQERRGGDSDLGRARVAGEGVLQTWKTLPRLGFMRVEIGSQISPSRSVGLRGYCPDQMSPAAYWACLSASGVHARLLDTSLHHEG